MSEMISETTKDKIQFDPNDLEGMCRIMDTYGKTDGVFFGKNENGEDVTIFAFEDRIGVKTFQKNGWARMNTYYRDGSADETFEGKWKDKSKTEIER